MADPPTIDLSAPRHALERLEEALGLWQALPQDSVLEPHLRSAVIQSFEFSYELSVRGLRRVLVERAASVRSVADLSFNDPLRSAADAGLLADPAAWRAWRELRDAFEASELPFRVDFVEVEGLAEGMAQRVAQEARELP